MANLQNLIVNGNSRLIGDATAQTPAAGTNNTEIATTAFVKAAIDSAVAGAKQEKTVDAGTSAKVVTPDTGKVLSKVTVNPTPSETKTATTNGTVSPTSGKYLSSVTVNVPASAVTSGNKSCASNESDQSNIDVTTYKTVSISGVGSSYVGSGITRRDSSSLSASGASVSVPAGYYASAASKSVATVTRAATTLTSSADTTNAKLTFTAGNNQGTGYVTGSNSTKSATVTLTVSGQSVTASDGTNSVSKSVASGKVVPQSSISGTSATASLSGTTLTLTKTISNTPTVSTTGWVSAGTAGNTSVSLTGTVPTEEKTQSGAGTVTPSSGKLLSKVTVTDPLYKLKVDYTPCDASYVTVNCSALGVTNQKVYSSSWTSSNTASVINILSSMSITFGESVVEGAEPKFSFSIDTTNRIVTVTILETWR